MSEALYRHEIRDVGQMSQQSTHDERGGAGPNELTKRSGVVYVAHGRYAEFVTTYSSIDYKFRRKSIQRQT